MTLIKEMTLIYILLGVSTTPSQVRKHYLG